MSDGESGSGVETGLKDMVNDFGDVELKEEIRERYGDRVVEEVLFGEPLEGVLEVKTATRSYDYGEASSQRVSECGVRVRFDIEETRLEALREGGEIRGELRELAEECFACELEDVDLHVVEGEYYEFWLVADVERLMG